MPSLDSVHDSCLARGVQRRAPLGGGRKFDACFRGLFSFKENRPMRSIEQEFVGAMIPSQWSRTTTVSSHLHVGSWGFCGVGRRILSDRHGWFRSINVDWNVA